MNSLNVDGVDSLDNDFCFGDLFIAGVAQAVEQFIVFDSTNAGLRNTARTCFSDIGSLVCSKLLDPPLEDTGTKIELTNVSINAGMAGWSGVVHIHICLNTHSLIGTLYFENARLFSSWCIQCTGKNPVTFDDKFFVTGTRTA